MIASPSMGHGALRGFARVRYDDCGREFRVTLSCKTRVLCPSYHARRAVLWAEWLTGEVLAPVDQPATLCLDSQSITCWPPSRRETRSSPPPGAPLARRLNHLVCLLRRDSGQGDEPSAYPMPVFHARSHTRPWFTRCEASAPEDAALKKRDGPGTDPSLASPAAGAGTDSAAVFPVDPS